MGIESFDIPVTDSVDATEAAATLTRIQAEAASNPEHPYTNNAHPQSRLYKEAVQRLYEIKNPEPPPQTNAAGEEVQSSWQPEHLAAMEEALDEQAFKTVAKQAEMAKSITADIKIINELMTGTDLDIDKVLENPTKSQMEGYKQMSLLAQGDYTTLMPLLIADVRALGMPSAKVDQVRAFLTTAQPGDPLSDDLTNVIIRHINEAKKRKGERDGNTGQ